MTDGFYVRWIIGGIVVLMIVVSVCYLWYQHDTAHYKREAAEIEEFARQWEKNQKAEPKATLAEQDAKKNPAVSDTLTVEKPKTETTEAILETNKPPVTQQNTKTLVSPHGFGTFPSIPKDYPYLKNWKKYTMAGEGPEFELMARVRIKLWKQGIRTQGIVTRGPLMFPIIRGTVYYSETQGTLSHPDDDLGPFDLEWEDPEAFLELYGRQKLTIDDFPAGLTVLDFDTAGINPYEFLNLN